MPRKPKISADIQNKIEEIHSDEETAPISGRTPSRNEVKARKALSKVGLKQVKGITRVTIRRTRQPILAISQPDVFKSLNTETYVVFGEAVADNYDMAAQLQAAQDVLKDAEAQEAGAAAATEEKAEEDDDEEVDETGVDQGDIELVTAQANVSRKKAVKALKNNNNDIVAAIMELTM
ncbi:hypothetical protein BGZ73_009178 [Actinomortierella ambigua]|nr:hypothetical protein BGZ73_009178 [Actinomortierella ambigua]